MDKARQHMLNKEYIQAVEILKLEKWTTDTLNMMAEANEKLHRYYLLTISFESFKDSLLTLFELYSEYLFNCLINLETLSIFTVDNLLGFRITG